MTPRGGLSFALAALAIAAAPGAVAAQDPPRPIGLVEMPGLYGSVDPDGPPGAMRPVEVEPVPLHLEPAVGAPFATVTDPDVLEWREHDYEAPAAMAYGEDAGWVLVALVDGRGDGARRLGWAPPAHLGALHRLGSLLQEGLAYLTVEWNGTLHDAPAPSAPVARFSPSTVGDIRDVNVVEMIEVDGVPWARVELLGSGRCEGVETPTVEAAGWLPALGPTGDPNLWFFARGC